MQNTPDPNTVLSAPPAKALFRTLLLAGSVFFIPVLIGALVVLASQRLVPSPAAAHAADAPAKLVARLHDGSATNIAQLTALRRDMRGAGLPTGEVDLRIWAARAIEPERLFHIPPPESGGRWNWHLAHDGLYALAVSAQPDTAGRRAVGLYDLVGEAWVWNSILPWPDTHEAPYVFDRRTIIRYMKNDTRFALEVDRDGKIISIDKLGAGASPQPERALPDPRFPGLAAVAIRHNVFFAADPQEGSLHGYANSPLPGLRHAGPCDATTTFSGNGFMKFSVVTGIVTVADSLTLAPLQTYKAWRAESDTVVNGMAASLDGSNLVVSLTSTFVGPPPVKRDWSMTIDLYSGKGKTNTGDQQPPVPERATSLTTLSPDGKWRFTVDADNALTVMAEHAKTPNALPAARVALAPLGLRAPIQSIAFLEGGRHLVIRQRAEAWLLDVTVARSYGGLMARADTCSRTISMDSYRVKRETASAKLATSTEGYGISEDYDDGDAFASDSFADTTAPSYLLMRAELFVDNQAWGYAAATLEEAARLQAHDLRAPKINPLLFARCQILAGQDKKARDICREALRTLLMRPVVYDSATGTTRSPPNIEETDNRMIRYHLQSILFAK